MRLFGLKTCDTTRAALRALRAAGKDPVVIDIRDDGVTPADQAAMLAAIGFGIINRASTTWRGLPEAERARDAADLLARYPTLMKRPVIEDAGKFWLGWDDAVQIALAV